MKPEKIVAAMLITILISLTLAVAADNPLDEKPDEPPEEPKVDADGDGFFACINQTEKIFRVDEKICDCNDDDPQVNPSKTEILEDGKDQNCKNDPPTITITQPADGYSKKRSARGGAQVSFEAVASDPDGDPLAITWNLGDSTTHIQEPYGAGKPTITTAQSNEYSNLGEKTVTVTASDGQYSAQDSVTIMINPFPADGKNQEAHVTVGVNQEPKTQTPSQEQQEETPPAETSKTDDKKPEPSQEKTEEKPEPARITEPARTPQPLKKPVQEEEPTPKPEPTKPATKSTDLTGYAINQQNRSLKSTGLWNTIALLTFASGYILYRRAHS